MRWLLLLSLFLFSCKPELEVHLASATETVASLDFVITEPGQPRPRFHTVQLFNGAGQVIWHLRAEPFGDTASTSALIFGAPPSGFEAVVPAPELPAGDYALVVTGTGRGQLRFGVDAAGRVSEQ